MRSKFQGRKGTIPEERFQAKINENGPIRPGLKTRCWIWEGGTIDGTYGGFQLGEWTYAHRASWILYKGIIPEGTLVCHHCDTPKCVNPEHLFLGADKDNTLDCMNKGRYVVMEGELNGASKLTEVQVLDIRRLAGTVSQESLGKAYGVTQAAISSIVRRINWKHI